MPRRYQNKNVFDAASREKNLASFDPPLPPPGWTGEKEVKIEVEMGKRGPHPEPTKLKVLKGNPGHRPLNEDEPQPLRAIPDCPSRLTEDERQIWDQVARKLFDMGVLTEIDDLALSVFCEYFSEYRKLSDQVKKTGAFIKVKNGTETKTLVDPQTGEKVQREVDRFVLQRSPIAGARDQAWAIAAKILADFGMNPSARSHLKTELGTQRPENSYEQYRKNKVLQKQA